MEFSGISWAAKAATVEWAAPFQLHGITEVLFMKRHCHSKLKESKYEIPSGNLTLKTAIYSGFSH